jgi:hypothetical protein
MSTFSLLLAASATEPAKGIGTQTEIKYAALGVGLSVAMPTLLAIVKKYWPGSGLTTWTGVWTLLVPYLALGAFSLVVAVLVSATAEFETTELALLAGFAWDKTLQTAKLVWSP